MALITVVFFYTWRYHKDILLQNPVLTPLLLKVELLTLPFLLISCMALWSRQRWGIWFITALVFILFCISYYSQTNTLKTFGIVLGYVVLWVFLYPHRKRLR